MGGKPGNGRPKVVRIGWVGSDGIGRVPLTHGAVAIVDAEDVPKLAAHGWYLDSHGYAATNIKIGHNKYQVVRMHRMILNAERDGTHIDHISRDRLDNRKVNLRFVNNSANMQNSPARKTKDRTSQYRGVSHTKNTTSKVWKAQIYVIGKKTYIGMYETEEEAAHAYDAYVRLYGDEHAYLNFPDEI